MNPTPSQIVNYTLTNQDAREVHTLHPWGSPHQEGDVYPMLIVRVTEPAETDVAATVNGRVFADANATLWVKDVVEGAGPGRWQWAAGSGIIAGGPDPVADETDEAAPTPRARRRKPKPDAAE